VSPPAAAAAARAPRAPAARRAHERTIAPPSRPRRVSGPARGLRRHADGASVSHERGIAGTLAAVLGRLAEHRLLTRLIAGKAWIAVVAFALIGIVTLQLSLLRLNTSIGRSLERQGTLQRENAALSIENSEMAAGERVESHANQLGMELVPQGALRFLASPGGGAVGKAAGALATPVQASAGGEAAAGTGSAGSGASASSGEAGTSTPAASGGESESAATGSAGGSAHEGEGSGESGEGRSSSAASGESSGSGAAAGAAEASSPSAGPAQGAGEAASAGGTGSGPSG
jgi:cell division protein FtsL